MTVDTCDGARAHYRVQPPSPKHSLLEVGKGRLHSIIQLSKMSPPRCDLFGTILFFPNHCLIPGWFPLLRPPPSLCSCPSGPVPISKPWGIDSGIHKKIKTKNWGFFCTSRLLFLSSEGSTDSCCCFDAQVSIHWRHFFGGRIRAAWGDGMVHSRAQTRDLNSTPFIHSIRVDGVKLCLSGWVKT